MPKRSHRVLAIVAIVVVGLIGPVSLSPSANASSSSPMPVAERQLTKLRFTIDSTSDWATIDLFGGSLYSQGEPAVTGGNGGPYSHTGFYLQTWGTAQLVVDAVYELPTTPLELRVCKNNDGVTSVRVDRITDTPVQVARVESTRTDGVWVRGCADRADTMVSPAALAAPYEWPRPVDNRRLTLAQYTPWYTPESFQSHRSVDQPVAPFDGSTQDGVTGMVNEAANSGVDAFLYWYNGDPEAERRYDLVMRAAETRPGFSVAAQLDLGALGGFQHGTVDAVGVESWMRTLLARASSPSYLRVGSRPVLFVWGTTWLPLGVWTAAIQSLRASGVDPFVVADGLDPSYGFDGFWVLNANNVWDSSTLTAWYDWWAKQARFTPERSLGSAPALWAAGISPGEDDTFSGKPKWQRWYVPRDGGERYDRVWQGAAASTPEWMVISTWNDFHEATYIQASQNLGRQALDQTAAWTAWFSDQ